MIDPEFYFSFRELILQGWFQKKHSELENTLRILERAGWLTGEQRRLLQLLALDGASPAVPVLAR
jgi:hypothetical protein